jgi:superfamily II DNA or RNA helicase
MMVELRTWQNEARAIIRAKWRPGTAPVIRAVMGAGKSILQATICGDLKSSVLVTAPTIRLVDQLAETIASVTGEDVAKYYTHEKRTGRITVACYDSLGHLAASGYRPSAWIADECHRTEVDDVKDAIALLSPTMRLGFTATPYLSGQGAKLTLWDEMVYSYGVQDAIRDKVVVPPKVVHYTGECEYLDDAVMEMIVKAKGPGVVSAINIADAEDFAHKCTEHGLFSRAIHSRMPKERQAELLDMLRAGDLHNLVHVNLLTEGVDLPWLRWLCLRRPGASRIRFAQEVGRVLRAHPGKTDGVVYDPHDLFGRLSLSYEACLGEVDGPSAEEAAAWDIDFAIEKMKAAGVPPETLAGVPVQMMEPIASYIRALRVAFQGAGAVEITIPAGAWRLEPANDKQMDMLRHIRTDWTAVPGKHVKALQSAISAAHVLSKGDVSDLISCLKAIKSGWPEVDA